MKKLLQLGAYVIAGTLLLNSCEAWEDDSYHEGGNNNGDGLLLKEIKTTSSGVEGLATYTYDDQYRIKEIYAYADILNMETYVHTVHTYTSDYNFTTEINSFAMGEISMNTDVTTQISGNTANTQIVVEYEFGGETISITTTNQATFSAPCGVTEDVTAVEMPGFPPVETHSTYEYTDENCSVRQFVDGVLSATITNDDKYTPFTNPNIYAMGISTHNPTRIENADGSIETIAYTYNEQGYPTRAVHTFSGTSSEANYTEEFTYY